VEKPASLKGEHWRLTPGRAMYLKVEMGVGDNVLSGIGERWVRFLRQYGPISQNENMYDEHIQRSARRLRVRAIDFPHPVEEELLAILSPSADVASSIVLTGTAGDGKSRLCGKAWSALRGDEASWASDEIYHEVTAEIAGRQRTVGVIRDLTGLPAAGPHGPYPDKRSLLEAVSASFFEPDPDVIFVVAANDGQLMEAWRRLGEDGCVDNARRLLEARLVGDAHDVGRVAFFHLSRVPCAKLLDLALDAVLSHEGWAAAYEEAEDDGFFGPRCPIRENYEALSDPAFQARLRQLFELLDLSELHTPIRRVLLLLANALLGHPKVKERLMSPNDVRICLRDRTAHLSDIHQNLFGTNLTQARRENLEVMEFLSRFGIGEETTNRIDNILLFGSDDEALSGYFDELVVKRTSAARLEQLRADRNAYLERPETGADGDHPFLEALAGQRRALFFRIPPDQAEELRLWSLTVFSHAGEFLQQVAGPLADGGRVPRPILARLVNGLNRVFTGMLVTTDRDLLLATSLSNSSSGTSQLLEDRVSVAPRREERVELLRGKPLPVLVVQLDDDTRCQLALNLVRYEFLMRVADGALPSSFSRECHEDILAFKSTILAALNRIRPPAVDGDLSFRLLTLNAAGEPADEVIEVTYA